MVDDGIAGLSHLEVLSLGTLLSQPMPDKVKKKVAMLGAILAQAMMKKDDDK